MISFSHFSFFGRGLVSHPESRRGAALVVVLTMIVLLSILILAFFSKTLLEHQISSSNSNQIKVDLLSQGAVDQILGDLKQEILAGSLVPSITPPGGTASVPSPKPVATMRTIYRPSKPITAVPSTQGPYAALLWNTKLLNLVKQSTHGVPFYPSTSDYDGNAPTRAAAVSTTSEAARLASGSVAGTSLNGRSIPISSWNQVLLLPKQSAALTNAASGTTITDNGTDVTPLSEFSAPDWILVSRDGGNPTAWNSNLKFGKNAQTVVGRYAYTIYNQGGLLDANVAGTPQANSLNASQQIIWRRKGSAAFADLAVIPGIANVTGMTPQKVVDQLVGWRNNASAQPSSTAQPGQALPSYTFSSSAVDRYLSFILGLPTRFMTAGNTSLHATSTQSDQLFSSRQQMIAFFQGLSSNTADKAYLQDAMMYLTHFSRTLNQPSVWPDPSRPMVVGPASNTLAGYTGGNSAHTKDNIYNPPFKSLRVATAYTRPDGSPAVAGEPLVKKRFALSRLCWLTYLGPSKDAGSVARQAYLAKGVSADLLDQGTAANIQKYFGLTWVNGIAGAGSPGGYWVYDHGLGLLGTLDLVAGASTPRDADFFELLQAAVHVGGFAKGSGVNAIGGSDFSVIQDANLTPRIMQLGANIIDGANPTQYPTHIVYNIGTSASPVFRSAFGVMDLPYLNSVNNVRFIVQDAIPAPPTANNLPQASMVPITATLPVNGKYSAAEGTGAFMMIPVLWNPYDVTGPSVSSTYAPADLRIVVSNPVPILNTTLNASGSGGWPSATGPWTLISNKYAIKARTYYTTGPGKPKPPGAAGTLFSTNGAVPVPTETWYVDNTTGLAVSGFTTFNSSWTSELSTALNFSNTATLYREPTALMKQSNPAGLVMDAGNIIKQTNPAEWSAGVKEKSGLSYVGFLVTTFPLRYSYPATASTPPAAPNPAHYIYSTNTLEMGTIPASGVSVRLQYKVGSVWIPYMEYNCQLQYPHDFVPVVSDGSAAFPYLLSPNNGSSTTGSLWNQNRAGTFGGGLNGEMTTYDPRAQTWGYPNDMGTPARRFIDGDSSGPASFRLQTLMPEASSASAEGTHASGTTMKGSGWYEPTGGLIPAIKQINTWSPPTALRSDYYADPDGTVRRAMGAYVGGNSNVVGNYDGSVTNWIYTANTTMGLPLASTQSYSASVAGTNYTPAAGQSKSRPLFLHRPYQSVAELGYVFSGTPWKNIDFFTPESPFGAFLDVFCINADNRPDAVIAGQVDLNGRQSAVFQALLAGAFRDEADSATAPLSTTETVAISRALVARTTDTSAGKGPLLNISDLVGKWVGSTKGTMAAPIDGSTSYSGFSSEVRTLYSGGSSPGNSTIQQFTETAMRALVDAGQAGTWNLLIDVIAQSGRFPGNANGLADFLVEGERHYWVHVSIDRSTGEIVDKHIEVVNE